MPYATFEDLIARYDENTIRDLGSDGGTPVTDLNTSPKIQEALAGAAGAVNSAVRTAGMYQVEDLEALEGDDASYLKDIVCDLAMFRLIKRRPEMFSDASKSLGKWAHEQLKTIREGYAVFPIDKNIEAGKPSIAGPSHIDYQNLNLIPDRTRRYYPHRQQRLPLGR